MLLVDADSAATASALNGTRPAVPVQDGNAEGLVDGISLVAGVRSGQPAVRTVVLAEKDDPRRAALALQAGACGWVAKDCSLSRLLTVIRGVLREETHLPPALLTGVLRELTAARKHRTESERLVESLTPRERECCAAWWRVWAGKPSPSASSSPRTPCARTCRTSWGSWACTPRSRRSRSTRRAGVGPVDLTGDVVERGGQLA